jgi:2-iminoacetate synthase
VKAREMRGLAMNEVSRLSFVEAPELLDEIFSTAKQIKEDIYGTRLVLSAPLYISNRCMNECSYCSFRAMSSSRNGDPHMQSAMPGATGSGGSQQLV